MAILLLPKVRSARAVTANSAFSSSWKSCAPFSPEASPSLNITCSDSVSATGMASCTPSCLPVVNCSVTRARSTAIWRLELMSSSKAKGPLKRPAEIFDAAVELVADDGLFEVGRPVVAIKLDRVLESELGVGDVAVALELEAAELEAALVVVAVGPAGVLVLDVDDVAELDLGVGAPVKVLVRVGEGELLAVVPGDELRRAGALDASVDLHVAGAGDVVVGKALVVHPLLAPQLGELDAHLTHLVPHRGDLGVGLALGGTGRSKRQRRDEHSVHVLHFASTGSMKRMGDSRDARG